MYKHILIPTDGSDLSRKAIEHGVALAKATGASVVGITVSPPFFTAVVDPVFVPETMEQYQANCAAHAERDLAVVRDIARTAGLACEGVHVFDDHPYRAIIATARERQCDLICMASHGRKGVSALLLGSETTKVLTHSAIPVLVCR
jgi:nucleotide-binding universal stress UspA family protein